MSNEDSFLASKKRSDEIRADLAAILFQRS